MSLDDLHFGASVASSVTGEQKLYLPHCFAENITGHHKFNTLLSRVRVPCVSGTLLGAEGTDVNRTDKNPCPHEDYV